MRYLRLFVNSINVIEEPTNATARTLSTWKDQDLLALRDDAQRLIDAILEEWAQREMLPHPFKEVR